MMNITEKTKKRLIKAGLAGVILSGATSALYGNGSVTIGGQSVPAMVPLFVAGSGASLATDLIHDQMNWSSVGAQKFSDISSLAIAGGISGAAAVAILKVGVGLPNDTVIPVLGIGAASQIGADYIEYKFLSDEAGKLIF
jgi:hypothetical protein